MKKEVRNPEMATVRENIENILKKLDIPFEAIKHQPVFTMKEAEKVSEHGQEEGVKTLLLKSNQDDLYLAVLRGDHRLDFAKIKNILNVKKISMAGDKDVQKIGVEIGALTPFGYELQLPVLLDPSIFDEKFVYINPGVNTETFKLKGEDLSKAIKFWAKDIYTI